MRKAGERLAPILSQIAALSQGYEKKQPEWQHDAARTLASPATGDLTPKTEPALGPSAIADRLGHRLLEVTRAATNDLRA